ncbi:MAG: SDR family oxidoreductase [Proteobacteria bacterium]|nr:SDR family oxidoreductase [Pseudomonadota bacterium]
MGGPTLNDRVALVTGVSRRRGIGFAIAERLASSGADLFLHSFAPYDSEQPWGADPQGVSGLVETLRAHGRRVEHLSADFSQPDSPERVVAAALAAFGHLDILVVNHAYSTAGALEDLEARDIDLHMTVNVRASLLLIKGFAAQHKAGQGGRIVWMTSGQHLHPMPEELSYVASKGALHQLTLSLSAHLAARGITVNAVNPGATDTGYADAELHDAVLQRSPQGRWGQPEDAARLVAWLASDEAGWITGQVINSTGGGV